MGIVGVVKPTRNKPVSNKPADERIDIELADVIYAKPELADDKLFREAGLENPTSPARPVNKIRPSKIITFNKDLIKGKINLLYNVIGYFTNLEKTDDDAAGIANDAKQWVINKITDDIYSTLQLDKLEWEFDILSDASFPRPTSRPLNPEIKIPTDSASTPGVSSPYNKRHSPPESSVVRKFRSEPVIKRKIKHSPQEDLESIESIRNTSIRKVGDILADMVTKQKSMKKIVHKNSIKSTKKSNAKARSRRSRTR